ncbi:hypothetical protein LJK87_15280 [Paenibacillus sp. P25]|nr:hypothetical protein LJK87_15280 [Paenibacillus sp. P25]
MKGAVSALKQIQFERGTAGKIRVHVLPTEQFKTFAISVYIGSPLKEETVTSTALIPFVLRRGSRSYPETKQFRERLDDLYGAGFGFDIYKRGDYQMVQFRMDVIQDEFVASSSSLLEQAIQFAGRRSRPRLWKAMSYAPSTWTRKRLRCKSASKRSSTIKSVMPPSGVSKRCARKSRTGFIRSGEFRIWTDSQPRRSPNGTGAGLRLRQSIFMW